MGGLIGRISKVKTPSRKQDDVFTPRTGSYVRNEKRTTTIYAGSVTGTLYTIPSTRSAKIIAIFARAYDNASTSLSVGGTNIISLQVGVGESSVVNWFFGYENGIDVSEGKAIAIGIGGAVAGFVSVVIVEESAAEGYFTD